MNKTATKYVSKKVFCPDDWDFEAANMHINYKIDGSDTVVFLMDRIDGNKWHGRKRQARCHGGGYDMRGTVVGNWMMKAFPLETQLDKIGYLADRMHYVGDGDRWEHVKAPHIFQTASGQIIVPRSSRLYGVTCKYDAVAQKPAVYIHYDGACGFRQMEDILYHLGYRLKWLPRSDRHQRKDFYKLLLINEDSYYRAEHNVLLLSPTFSNLIFRKEEQAVMPKGLEGEDLRDWLYDPDNIKHSTIKIPVQQIDVLEAVFNTHLDQDWSEYRYSREDGNMRWDSTSSTRVGSSLRSIKSMSLLNDESGIKVIPFKELEI